MSLTRMFRLMAAALILALALTACASDDETTDETAEAGDEAAADAEGDEAAASYELITDGTLTVCTDAPYEPFEYEDTEAPSGFSGFDIDLVQHMADHEGLDLTVIVTGFDGIQSGAALAAGSCDLAASAMTITPEREENLDFLDPYFDADQSLLSTVDGPQSLAEVTSLGVQADTTGAAYAAENFEGELTEFPDEAALSAALAAGNIQAILQDLPVNALNASNNDDFVIAETYPTGEQYGFAVAEGNTALADAMNAALADSREDGDYDTIYAKYFEV